MMQLWIATSNPGKLEEFRSLLSHVGTVVRSLSELDSELHIEETGSTFAQNAALKARAVHQVTGEPALADDSGLVVDALDGRPGVHSARYAGVSGKDRDRANYQKLLDELDGVPENERTAHFACALVYIDEKGKEHLFEGSCPGYIGFAPRGNNGFGYDPVFFPQRDGHSMAELTAKEKNDISHRGQAVRSFARFFEQGLFSGNKSLQR